MNRRIEITLFYANWCGHCIDFKHNWNIFKEQILKLDNKIKIKVKEYEHEELTKNNKGKINGKDIEGYPTIKIELSYGNIKKDFNYDDYGNNRESIYMIKYIENLCNLLEKYNN
jgi:hypothetical protein